MSAWSTCRTLNASWLLVVYCRQTLDEMKLELKPIKIDRRLTGSSFIDEPLQQVCLFLFSPAHLVNCEQKALKWLWPEPPTCWERACSFFTFLSVSNTPIFSPNCREKNPVQFQQQCCTTICPLCHPTQRHSSRVCSEPFFPAVTTLSVDVLSRRGRQS